MDAFTKQWMADKDLREFLKNNMMGPNAMRLSEEMASCLDIQPDMRVLDLGCGCGLSTLLLVKKYGVSVFAADLWISPTDNYARFQEMGMDDRAVPISVDATQGLPFANRYFDLLFSVDAYHYFGDTPAMLPSLLPFVKRGGTIAIAIPGLKYEFGDNVPEEMKPFWSDEAARTLHSLAWWEDLWGREKGIEVVHLDEMACCTQAWSEWLTAHHPVVAEDREMMKAEGGQYFNLIQMIAKVL